MKKFISQIMIVFGMSMSLFAASSQRVAHACGPGGCSAEGTMIAGNYLCSAMMCPTMCLGSAGRCILGNGCLVKTCGSVLSPLFCVNILCAATLTAPCTIPAKCAGAECHQKEILNDMYGTGSAAVAPNGGPAQHAMDGPAVSTASNKSGIEFTAVGPSSDKYLAVAPSSNGSSAAKANSAE